MGTKENNTKATETANEFTWSLDNTSKIFPIDYSVHELSDKHWWDPRAIRKNLICNPLIKDTLYQLLEGNEEKNGISCMICRHRISGPSSWSSTRIFAYFRRESFIRSACSET